MAIHILVCAILVSLPVWISKFSAMFLLPILLSLSCIFCPLTVAAKKLLLSKFQQPKEGQ